MIGTVINCILYNKERHFNKLLSIPASQCHEPGDDRYVRNHVINPSRHDCEQNEIMASIIRRLIIGWTFLFSCTWKINLPLFVDEIGITMRSWTVSSTQFPLGFFTLNPSSRGVTPPLDIPASETGRMAKFGKYLVDSYREPRVVKGSWHHASILISSDVVISQNGPKHDFS